MSAQGRDARVERAGLPADVAREATNLFNETAGLRQFGRLEVEQDRVIEGDVAVVNGPVFVSGTVRGRLLAINSDVVLRPSARIDGDLLVVGGEVEGRHAAFIGGDVKKHRDFRRLLDDKDVDAIVVATPDHWHALMTMLACAAGKDVYVEKPVTLFPREGRWMLDAARKHKRVVQVGTQQRSGKHYRRARELLRGGRLGKVLSVRMHAYRNVLPGFGRPADTEPPGVGADAGDDVAFIDAGGRESPAMDGAVVQQGIPADGAARDVVTIPDKVPPAAVVDLAATAESHATVTLSWTAPADEGDAGTVAARLSGRASRHRGPHAGEHSGEKGAAPAVARAPVSDHARR